MGRRILTAGHLALVGVVAAALVVGAVSFHITRSTETAGGVSSSTQFLVHWQQTGSESGTVPGRLPLQLSGTVAGPTVLPRANSRFLLNPGTRGHEAMEWLLSETVGMSVSTEMELTFVVHYTVGTTATTFSGTFYVETQPIAITVTETYTVFFDTGHATGVTFDSQLQISQACAAVGTCP